MREEIQRSLFSNKDDFNPDKFKLECLDSAFVECVRQGIICGFQNVTKIDWFNPRKRVKSDMLHDAAFTEIQNLANAAIEDISFHGDMSGNKRLWFSYRGYIFVLRKAESDGNKSVISDVIDAQGAESHVITIEYAVSAMWDKIVSISFQYIKNKSSEMSIYIPMQENGKIMFIDGGINTIQKVEPVKPMLRISKVRVE